MEDGGPPQLILPGDDPVCVDGVVLTWKTPWRRQAGGRGRHGWGADGGRDEAACGEAAAASAAAAAYGRGQRRIAEERRIAPGPRGSARMVV